jgi:GTP-binding protein
MPKPIVALVGRPNVGKSAVFNRIVGRRVAIVEDLAGTTRDRIYADAEWAGVSFVVVDTGGLVLSPPGSPDGARRAAPIGQTAGVASGLFLEQMRQQAQLAIAEADVVVFVVDAETGPTADDQQVAGVLRRSQRPVILAANKADNPHRVADSVDLYSLGMGEPLAISALHGQGVGELLDAIVRACPAVSEPEGEDEVPKIAIVGRPNVGKSSLLNRLLGQERMIVSDVPGTTRDAIDTQIQFQEQPVILIDTAGIRRRGKIAPGVEKHSVLRTLKAINRADVCLLLVDAQDKVTEQDQHIAGYVLSEEKSAVIVVNKWDTIEKDNHTLSEYTRAVRQGLGFMDYVPVVFVSALTGQRVNQALEIALTVRAERRYHLSTSELNQMLQDAVAHHPPKSRTGRPARFFYATQPELDPPTFVFFVNDRSLVHFTYQRYLENRIREAHGFLGTPLHLIFRSRGEKPR